MALVPEDSEMEQKAAKSPSLDFVGRRIQDSWRVESASRGLADSDNDRLWWLLAYALQAAGPLRVVERDLNRRPWSRQEMLE
jgi:hypothetical protein